MNLEVGKSYIIDTISANGRTQLYGKLINIQYNIWDSPYTGYTFENCVCKTEDGEVYSVSDPVHLTNISIFSAIKIEPMVETLIYSLAQRNPNVLDAATVEQLVSTVSAELNTHPFQNPSRTAVNIHGDNEADNVSEVNDNDDNFDYGGGKRKSMNTRSLKRRNRRSSKRRNTSAVKRR